MSYNNSIEDNKVIITLTVEQQAASTALAAAARAESAKTAAEAQAEISQEAANTANTASAQSLEAETEAKAARDIAIQKALETDADRQATAADRTQTASDRSATAADRAQTEADRIATGADRTQTGADRTATESASLVATQQATIATTARSEAETAKIAAQQSASNAGTSASEAAVSATNALSSKNAAESAALQTASDRSATEADRAQTEADRIATGADRTQTGADRSATESASLVATQQATLATTARSEAETAKIAAQQSANNAGTSASEAAVSATNALSSKNAAESARNEIVEKVNFTGAAQGDLLERNSEGVFVPKSARLINHSKVPFQKSPVIQYRDLSLFAWDNGVRPDTPLFSGAGTLDSGQNWLNLSGQNGRIVQQLVTLSTNITGDHILAFERTQFGTTGNLVCDFIWRGNNNTFGRFFIGKDTNNCILFRIGYFTNQIIARVNGVETVIASSSLNVLISRAIALSLIRCRVILCRNGVSGENYLALKIHDLNHNLEATDTQIGSLMSFFTSAQDVKYIGLSVNNQDNLGIGISNLKCYSI
jgi:hypothetical protein